MGRFRYWIYLVFAQDHCYMYICYSLHSTSSICMCYCSCSVSPASRGLAFTSKAPAAATTALRMSEVADAAVVAEDEQIVMRPPINMPWESISDQVRLLMFYPFHPIQLYCILFVPCVLVLQSKQFGCTYHSFIDYCSSSIPLDTAPKRLLPMKTLLTETRMCLCRSTRP